MTNARNSEKKEITDTRNFEDGHKTDELPSRMDRFLRSPWLISIAALAIAFYILAASTCSIDTPMMGGAARLITQNSTLCLRFQTRFNLLELYFEDAFSTAGPPKLYTNGSGGRKEISKEEADISVSSQVITVSVAKDKSISPPSDLVIYFKDPAEGVPIRRFIKRVKVDNSYVDLREFILFNLDQKASNVKYYRLFSLYNISHTLAGGFGWAFTLVITYVLVVVFGVQVFVIIITFIRQYLPHFYDEVGPTAKKPLLYFDDFADKYATMFGFLGTVSSLWTGLEKTDQYDSFFQILALVKYAIFTTVLGVVIKLIYEIRLYLRNLRHGQ